MNATEKLARNHDRGQTRFKWVYRIVFFLVLILTALVMSNPVRATPYPPMELQPGVVITDNDDYTWTLTQHGLPVKTYTGFMFVDVERKFSSDYNNLYVLSLASGGNACEKLYAWVIINVHDGDIQTGDFGECAEGLGEVREPARGEVYITVGTTHTKFEF